MRHLCEERIGMALFVFGEHDWQKQGKCVYRYVCSLEYTEAFIGEKLQTGGLGVSLASQSQS